MAINQPIIIVKMFATTIVISSTNMRMLKAPVDSVVVATRFGGGLFRQRTQPNEVLQSAGRLMLRLPLVFHTLLLVDCMNKPCKDDMDT